VRGGEGAYARTGQHVRSTLPCSSVRTFYAVVDPRISSACAILLLVFRDRVESALACLSIRLMSTFDFVLLARGMRSGCALFGCAVRKPRSRGATANRGRGVCARWRFRHSGLLSLPWSEDFVLRTLAKSGPETIAIHSGPPSVDGNESKITLRLRPGPVNGECTPRSMQHGQRLS